MLIVYKFKFFIIEEDPNEEYLEDDLDDMDEDPLTPLSHNNIDSIINLIKKEFYNSLFNYWDDPPNSTLLASLLDPRFKMMYKWSSKLQRIARNLLNEEYS